MMSLPLFGPDGRFAWIVAALCRAVAASLGRRVMDGPTISLVWRRMMRAQSLFLALAERVRSGRYRGGIVRLSRASETGGLEAPAGGAAPVQPDACVKVSKAWRLLPRRFGWLLGLMPLEAGGYASQLAHVLVEPEMVALLRDVPQAGRILRPLCWMLGIERALVQPGAVAVERVPAAVVAARIRAVRPDVDWGRIPLPRGVLAWALRERRLEKARARVLNLGDGLEG